MSQTILILGASGATGQLTITELLSRGCRVKVVVRRGSAFTVEPSERLIIIYASINDLSTDQMKEYLEECTGVICCLGHNPTLSGIFGKPFNLVTDAVRLVAAAALKRSNSDTLRFILMNTAGNHCESVDGRLRSFERRIRNVLGLILPPFRDHMRAAAFLQNKVDGSYPLKWVVLRPDSLINQATRTSYELFPSPVRSALCNPGQTSRVNVAHCLASLATDHELFTAWEAKMPVIYNSPTSVVSPDLPAKKGL